MPMLKVSYLESKRSPDIIHDQADFIIDIVLFSFQFLWCVKGTSLSGYTSN